MSTPTDLRYTETHEWARKESDGHVSVGITDHAQSALGDIVFLELPKVGRVVARREACAVVESVKAASDITAPIAGVIVDVNPAASEKPESVNADPYGVWLYKINPVNIADMGQLLDAAAYDEIIQP